jgi:hypothetical protein
MIAAEFIRIRCIIATVSLLNCFTFAAESMRNQCGIAAELLRIRRRINAESMRNRCGIAAESIHCAPEMLQNQFAMLAAHRCGIAIESLGTSPLSKSMYILMLFVSSSQEYESKVAVYFRELAPFEDIAWAAALLESRRGSSLPSQTGPVAVLVCAVKVWEW